MKRILFLDDDPNRQAWAKKHYDVGNNYFAAATTAQEAIDWLEWGEPEGFFDEVYLDHDLGGEQFVDSELKNCGMEVVRWMEDNRPSVGKVTIHSLNTVAALEMSRRLSDARYAVRHKPFTVLMSEALA